MFHYDAELISLVKSFPYIYTHKTTKGLDKIKSPLDNLDI